MSNKLTKWLRCNLESSDAFDAAVLEDDCQSPDLERSKLFRRACVLGRRDVLQRMRRWNILAEYCDPFFSGWLFDQDDEACIMTYRTMEAELRIRHTLDPPSESFGDAARACSLIARALMNGKFRLAQAIEELHPGCLKTRLSYCDLDLDPPHETRAVCDAKALRWLRDRGGLPDWMEPVLEPGAQTDRARTELSDRQRVVAIRALMGDGQIDRALDLCRAHDDPEKLFVDAAWADCHQVMNLARRRYMCLDGFGALIKRAKVDTLSLWLAADTELQCRDFVQLAKTRPDDLPSLRHARWHCMPWAARNFLLAAAELGDPRAIDWALGPDDFCDFEPWVRVEVLELLLEPLAAPKLAAPKLAAPKLAAPLERPRRHLAHRIESVLGHVGWRKMLPMLRDASPKALRGLKRCRRACLRFPRKDCELCRAVRAKKH